VTILPEPGIGYPANRCQARTLGRHGTLHPGETIEYAITAVVYEGRERVTGISPLGEDS
jgi:hypothetical protein